MRVEFTIHPNGASLFLRKFPSAVEQPTTTGLRRFVVNGVYLMLHVTGASAVNVLPLHTIGFEDEKLDAVTFECEALCIVCFTTLP